MPSHEDESSGLMGLSYSGRAHDLVRFVDDPVDGALAPVVLRASDMSVDARDAFRAALTSDDYDNLIAFSKRRAAGALRERSLPNAFEAVLALALIDRSKIDFRDFSVDFPLYSVRELGGDLDEVVAHAVGLSEPGTATVFAARAEPCRTLTLKECALLEVRSSYGLGYMTRWTAEYAPTTRLAELSVLLADAIDAEGQYVTDDLRVCDLPEVWFDKKTPQANVAVTGCVGLNARLRDSRAFSHGLLVFVAELRDELLGRNLASLAHAASTDNRPRVTSVRDRRIVLIVGGSTTAGEAPRETRDSLARYAQLAARLLEDGSLRP